MTTTVDRLRGQGSSSIGADQAAALRTANIANGRVERTDAVNSTSSSSGRTMDLNAPADEVIESGSEPRLSLRRGRLRTVGTALSLVAALISGGLAARAHYQPQIDQNRGQITDLQDQLEEKNKWIKQIQEDLKNPESQDGPPDSHPASAPGGVAGLGGSSK